MKKILLIREADKNIFYAIKDGTKSFETRAAIPEYQKIKTGDIIVFVCAGKRLEKKVKNVQYFKSISELFSKIDIQKVLPGIQSIKEAEKIYLSFPNYKEKLKKFGLIVFEL